MQKTRTSKMRHEQKLLKERTEKLLKRGKMSTREEKRHKACLDNLNEIEKAEKAKK